MTTLETAERIQARAAALDPAKVLLLLAIAPFFLIGATLRLAWWPLAFAIAAGVDGWVQANRSIKAAEARLAERRGP